MSLCLLLPSSHTAMLFLPLSLDTALFFAFSVPTSAQETEHGKRLDDKDRIHKRAKQQGFAQFVDTSSKLSLALSNADNVSTSSSDLLMQISAPISFGWGAVGVGDKMGGSLMFILYPSSSQNEVTASVRSAGGHDVPHSAPGIDFAIQSSSIANTVMKADVPQL